VVPGRLERAIANGAELVVNPLEEDAMARIHQWTGGEGPAVVFEATGVASVFRTAVDVVAHSGTVVVAGTSDEDVSIPSLTLVKKEVNLLGSRNNAGIYGSAVDIVRRYQERCESLITQRWSIDQVQDAMEFGSAHPAEANKMVVVL
jgi:threonine dehydrogenase-like Zn-dependent dehydrogenase